MKPYSKDNADIIQFLIDERIAQGISIRALASKCHVYPNQINQALAVDHSPKIDTLVKLGNSLGVTFSTSNSKFYSHNADELIEVLAQARKDQGITTRELSAMTGIVLPSICGILSHKVMPILDTYLKIASALGIELQLYSVRK